MRAGNTIYHENCLETMSHIVDKGVDMVVTSPPYNMNLRIRDGKYCSRQIVKNEFSTKYKGFDDNLPIDEFYEQHKKILSELLRIGKTVFYNFQIVTGSKRAFFKLIGEFNEQLKDIIVWDKVNSQPAMKWGVMNSQYEFILVFGDEPMSRQFKDSGFDRGTVSNLWEIKRGKKSNKEHGAVFPEELVEKIITTFAPKDTHIKVYDPFCGSGTTMVVAKRMGHTYMGSELLLEYFNSAVLRTNTVDTNSNNTQTREDILQKLFTRIN